MKIDTYIQCDFSRVLGGPSGTQYIERLTAFIPNDKRIKEGVSVELIDPHSDAPDSGGWWKVDRVGKFAAKQMDIKRGWNNNI